MSKKRDRVLAAIFAEPVRANIVWHDVESLLKFLGAEIREGAGSRVLVALNGVRAVLHEPHPEKELSKPAVRAVRDFLRNAGVAPE
jgi:hypothetical protein